MLLPSDSWQMLLPFCFGGWCYCPHWIDIILSNWQMLLPYLQVVDGISTFFFFFFFVVDVITTRELCHGQMLLPIVADVIATGQP